MHISWLIALNVIALAVIPCATWPNFGDLYKNFFTSITGSEQEATEDREKRQISGASEWVIETQALPLYSGTSNINFREMPVLGNGYLATTMYSDKMYISGFYAGTGGDMHRAAVPPYIMGRIDFRNQRIESTATRRHYMNAKTGVYTEVIETSNAYIEHRTFVHKRYIRVFVMDVYVRWKSGANTIYFNYTSNLNNEDPTAEVVWELQPNTDAGEVYYRGRIRDNSGPEVHLFTQTRLAAIDRASGGQLSVNYTKVMAVDTNSGNARTEFQNAYAKVTSPSGGSVLLDEHIEAWRKTWEDGYVHLENTDLQLRQQTIFSQFYMLSSLPSSHASQPLGDSEVYYGDSRSSLGKGSAGEDYQGHRFWDTEMYVMPAFVLFRPQTVKKMLQYRTKFAEAAQQLAESMGARGYRFPWESGVNGEDVTPDSCIQCREQQIFVSGAISFAIRQYVSVTNDRDYMTRNDFNGCGMTYKIAEFYQSIAKYNNSKARYDIKNVMGPDDWHPNVHNSAVVNVLASLAIHWAHYMTCLCNVGSVPSDWIQTALYLDMPFDNVKRLHYPFEGFQNLPANNQTVKQADAILLTFPIAWNMSADIMRNDLLYYEQLMDQRTPAMTWSFFTVGFKFVDETAKMDNAFLRSYQDYTKEPFKIWTEYSGGQGSTNYLPGMGGFVQSLIYGFGGVRIRPQSLEFHNPIPPGTSSLTLVNFKYRSTNMTITIQHGLVTIQVHNILDGTAPDVMLRRNHSNYYQVDELLQPGMYVEITQPQSGFYMFPKTATSCEYPRDYIYMPWGYSPWINASPRTTLDSVLIVAVLLCSLWTSLRMLTR